jgi:hypothetical protein
MGKMMSDDKKTKDRAPKKESKVAAAAPTADAAAKTESKPDAAAKTESTPDAAPKSQGMGEGQKPVSQAYKDNWNAIFAKKKKSR